VASTGDQIVSVSWWGSRADAEAAAPAILEWVKGQSDILNPPTASHIGDEVMSA
jgi:hypothetical protein